MNSLVQKEVIKGNPYAFEKMRVTNGLYVPINSLSAKTGWRYVWYKSKNNAVLAKGAERYEFTSFSKVVAKNGEQTNMPLPAMTQNILYVPSGYVSLEWGFITIYLTNSDYAVLADEKLDKESEKLMQQLLAN